MFQLYDVAIIPLILGVVELFKRSGLPAKYASLIAVIFGLLFSIAYLDIPTKESIIIGLVIGLSASGLYSSTKNIVEKDDLR